MGLRLDWEVESDRSRIRNTAGEDPEARRRRRGRRLRILLLVGFVLALFAIVILALVFRLRSVEQQIEQTLRDTVIAEVANLRIGDENAYLAAQRSATNQWVDSQREQFEAYQALKIERDLQLPGTIRDLEVDGQRGRAHVEEILDGVTYEQIWFYWRYEDGWRHVPPDYTLWGAPVTTDAQGFTLRYNSVDADLAQALQPQFESWLEQGCGALDCSAIPPITVEILADPAVPLRWSPDGNWVLQIPSPHIQTTRVDQPWPPDSRLALANLLAERLVFVTTGGLQPVYPADAFYWEQAATRWLAGRFTGGTDAAPLIESLAQQYGDATVGRLLQATQPDSSVALIGQVAGVASLEQANLDWRDWLTWRLSVEDDMIARRQEDLFLTLYDTRMESARNIAYSRFNAALPGQPKTVVAAVPGVAADGTPQLHARVQVGAGDALQEQEIIFRLVDGIWRRAN